MILFCCYFRYIQILILSEYLQSILLTIWHLVGCLKRRDFSLREFSGIMQSKTEQCWISLFVRKSTEHFLGNILEVVFHSMWLFIAKSHMYHCPFFFGCRLCSSFEIVVYRV